MFDFRDIELKDRDWINETLAISDFRGSEYSFANNVAWKRLSDTVICRYNEFYISCSFDNGQPLFTFPAGVKTDEKGIEKYKTLFSKLEKYSLDNGKRFCLVGVNDENIQWLKDEYGDRIVIENDRGSSDYIYNSQDLINYPGKKFHGKRNHIKRFMDNEWSYEPINSSNLDECFKYAIENYNHKENNDFSAVVEQYAINLYFSNMDYFGLKGGVLRSDGKIVGISIGERINSDTFIVHVEKANAGINGAYPMICNQFAKANAFDCKYINREEDLDIEGLRKSKLSYNPAFLLNKYRVLFN